MSESIPNQDFQEQEKVSQKKSYIFRKTNITENFTTFSNTLLRNKELSLKALGLLVYLLSFPPDWKIYADFIIKERKEGEFSIYNTIKELIEKGYIKHYQERNEKGIFGAYVYEVFSEPQPVEKEELKKCLPHRGFPDAGFPHADNQELLSINSTKELDTTKKEISKEKPSVAKAPSPLALKLLAEFNESLSKNIPEVKEKAVYSQAKYFDQLLKKGYSEDKIKEALNFAHTDPFWSGLVHKPSYFKLKFNTFIASKARNGNRYRGNVPPSGAVHFDNDYSKYEADLATKQKEQKEKK